MRRLALALALLWLILPASHPAVAQPRRAGPPEGAAVAGTRLVIFEVFMSFG
jgi:hypothetical protein